MVGRRLFKSPAGPCQPAAHLFPWQKDEAVAKVLITCIKVLQQQSFQGLHHVTVLDCYFKSLSALGWKPFRPLNYLVLEKTC
jgi:hypothetical protein